MLIHATNNKAGKSAPVESPPALPQEKNNQIDAAVIAFLVLEDTQQVTSRTAQILGKEGDNIVNGAERRNIDKMRAFDGFKPVYETDTRSPTYTTESISSWDKPHHHGGTLHRHNVKTAAEDQGRLQQITSERNVINEQFGVENQQTQTIDTKLNTAVNNSAMTLREASSILRTYAQLMFKVLQRRAPNV